jgi:predicted transglutaminase-like cysteine proteinase
LALEFPAPADSAPAPPAISGPPQTEQRQIKPVRLFGTVEFRSALKNLPKWERVAAMEKAAPTFAPGGKIPANVRPRWERLEAELRGKSPLERVQGVNNFFNQWPYKTDPAVWGLEDYWATPQEFMQKSGDCEDYAITKYYALRSLGIPASQLRIVALKDNLRNLGHAVLAFIDGDQVYILDNLTNLVLSHKKLTHYDPQFSVNEDYLWRHVKPVARPAGK